MVVLGNREDINKRVAAIVLEVSLKSRQKRWNYIFIRLGLY